LNSYGLLDDWSQSSMRGATHGTAFQAWVLPSRALPTLVSTLGFQLTTLAKMFPVSGLKFPVL